MLMATFIVLGGGLVHTDNSQKADYPWLCVDLGEEALIYSAGIYTDYGSKICRPIFYVLKISITC